MPAFVNPSQILQQHMDLKRNMFAADFGCGSGEWAIAAARLLEHGKVWAIDLLEEPLSAARSRARVAGLENIEFVKGDIEKTISRLRADSLDLALMTNLLFQIDDKDAVFGEAKRTLKPGGKILIIDWKTAARIGPGEKISPQEIKKIAARAGFELTDEFDAGSFHYGLVFAKK